MWARKPSATRSLRCLSQAACRPSPTTVAWTFALRSGSASLYERHRILSLSGPTKSGKTVLLRAVVDNPVWLAGGEIRNVDEFWGSVVDRLGVVTDLSQGDAIADTASTHRSAGATVVARVETGSSASVTTEKSYTGSKHRDVPSAARQGLSESGRALVIDDFHYIPQDAQLAIVRGSIPGVQRSACHPRVGSSPRYDAARVEKEMTGRATAADQFLVGR